MVRLTQKLLDRASKIAAEKSAVSGLLTDAFEARYGTTYSDVDADGIIDALDCGGGKLTLAQCDTIMAGVGFPPLSGRRALSAAKEKQ